jgi:hypothetical protein
VSGTSQEAFRDSVETSGLHNAIDVTRWVYDLSQFGKGQYRITVAVTLSA